MCLFVCRLNGLLQTVGCPPHAQKNVQGKWAAYHPHCAFRHGSTEAQPHIIISNMYCGARATSDGIVTDTNTFEASSLLHPYCVESAFGGCGKTAALQIAACICALPTSCVHFRLLEAATSNLVLTSHVFLTSFSPEFPSDI